LNAKTLDYCEDFIVTARFATISPYDRDIKSLKHRGKEEAEGLKMFDQAICGSLG
jgi:hypothetical protein